MTATTQSLAIPAPMIASEISDRALPLRMRLSGLRVQATARVRAPRRTGLPSIGSIGLGVLTPRSRRASSTGAR